MIELSADELAVAEQQLAQRPERRARAQSWQPVPDKVANNIIAVASGKGGVGKSTITANLAVIAAQHGLKVGVIDADLHGFSLTRLLGVTEKPHRASVEVASTSNQPRAAASKVVPPEVYGVKVISIGMFTDPQKAVIWRGPVAHRAITQFLMDTQWGQLDLLLIDLPPGTGDVALSIANLVPDAELLVVTTPQPTSAEVAARAGAMAAHTHQKVIGVVENMAWLTGADGEKLEIFGSGGGAQVAQGLTQNLGYQVNLLGQIPMDPQLPGYADNGKPIIIGHPESPASQALNTLFVQVIS